MLYICIYLILSLASAALANWEALSGSDICQQIQGNITGDVYLPLDWTLNYASEIEHWMTSSTQNPACTVKVASDEDVSTALKIIAANREPFAVKSGGHASNPGFSSTTGVHISLANFNQVTLSEDKSTVVLGTGSIWTDVFTAIDGTGVNVVGGRVVGPGVGGFTLGGGYSWLTDQYGLTCDTVVSFNLVLPNGTITTVDSTNPDLFFALKGGLNRFGIVTSVVLKTVPQVPMIYGGFIVYGVDAIPDLIAATDKFQNENTDPKAQVILTINNGLIQGAILIMFYDGPDRPAAFDPYNNVSSLPIISEVKTQSFASFAKVTPSNLQAGYRGSFHSMMTTGLTEGFMKAVYNESVFYGATAVLHGGTFLNYEIEPFLDYGKYATESAFPHEKSPIPLNVYFAWKSPSSSSPNDEYWRGLLQQTISHLTDVAKSEGIYSEDLYTYPNYALSTYNGNQIYGPTNAARLREIREKYDPDGVMLLAGGFDI